VSAPYRPGQQWPDNRPQRPERPPPIQFRQEEPPPSPNKALQWALRAAGLVAVAVVSGLVWYYIINDTTTPTKSSADESSTQQPEGRYPFAPHEEMPSPDRATDCAKHAYDATKGFLTEHPCDHVARQLFTTEVDGRTVYTSVSVVVMPDEELADDLRRLTDIDGKGNINDVVRDHLVKIDGLKTLGASDGYKSKQTGREVVIVESDFAPKDKSDNKKADQDLLDDVSDDALRLADQVNGDGSGAG
jgi:hypothetical protein